jgi:nitrate reductase gamma subunit
MDWDEILRFARGPFFQVSLLIFVAGMVYRLVRVLALGWPKDRVPNRGSKLWGVLVSFAKGLLVLPFVPWVKHTFSKNPVPYVAGGLFHLGLFAVIIFGTPHMLAWKSLLGFGWPTLPLPITDWLAAVAIIALVVLALHRATNPVMKLISGRADRLSWLLVFVPMVTGYMMTHHLWFRYEVLFSLHMIAVSLLLIWIPMSKISHVAFYFFARTIHGAQFGKRAVTP